MVEGLLHTIGPEQCVLVRFLRICVDVALIVLPTIKTSEVRFQLIFCCHFLLLVFNIV